MNVTSSKDEMNVWNHFSCHTKTPLKVNFSKSFEPAKGFWTLNIKSLKGLEIKMVKW